MIDLPAFQGRVVAVLGLARSGLATVKALEASGATVLAWDDSEAARAKARTAGATLCELASADLSGWAALVMSPGIPLTHPPHPIAAKAKAKNVPVIGDIELLALAETQAIFIGITGTNGKSTTTTLIAHILKEAGREVAVGGNLGYPVLDLPRLDRHGIYVIEMSSFQLDLIDKTRFNIALLLNIAPDHLDRHGNMNGYIAAKERLFHRQQSGDVALIGADDDFSRALAHRLRSTKKTVVPISAEGPVVGGIWVSDGVLIDDAKGAAQEILDLRKVATLPGQHNWQNAAAAYGACRYVGLAPQAIASAMKTYPGLAHRQELVGTMGHVRFINDSKATNADAASKALGCYDRIFWIAGGVPKSGGIEDLKPYFNRIAHAYLIGDAAEQFATTIGDSAPVTISGNLATAVRQAAIAAADDLAEAPVVLLSPACASYDQFPNFEGRGDTFRQLVAEIAA